MQSNRTTSFTPPKHSGDLCIPQQKWEFLCHTLFLKKFPFLLGPKGPTLIFLDELTRIPMVAANFLMTILDRRQSYLYDEDSGIRYNKGENVLFAAAGNTGFAYVSTQRLDSAFEDRFVKVQLDYLTPEEEAGLIVQRFPAVKRVVAQQLADVARLLRQAEQKEALTVSLSTRQVLDAAAYLQLGYTLREVVEEVILTNYVIAGEQLVARSLVQMI